MSAVTFCASHCLNSRHPGVGSSVSPAFICEENRGVSEGQFLGLRWSGVALRLLQEEGEAPLSEGEPLSFLSLSAHPSLQGILPHVGHP